MTGHVMNFEQFKQFVFFLITMAGGNPDDANENTIDACYRDFWNPLETARQVLQEMTNGEYLRSVEQRKQRRKKEESHD